MHDGSPPKIGFRVLATDLDGTLIPIHHENRTDLDILARELKTAGVTLVFVTGRHYASVRRAMIEHDLPAPDWIICDVGTSIRQRCNFGAFEPVKPYERHQDQIIDSMSIPLLRGHIESIAGLRLQESEKQGKFKLSFYADADRLGELVARIHDKLDQMNAPYSIVASIDPFNGDGLIDLLPRGVSKAHALMWWVKHVGFDHDDIVFAGDSGNDLAALTAGYRSIVVGNADRAIANQVRDAHCDAGWSNRLCLADRTASSGVLEGCRWFGMEKGDNSPEAASD